jgi:hypothetical protein
MVRPLHADTIVAVQERVVRPVLIGRLEIVSDPIIAWTGPGIFAPVSTGDAAMDGQTFSPLAPFLEMDNINENQSFGGPVTLTLTGHDLDVEALRQVVRDKRQWRGQKAWLWQGLLSADEKTVVLNPVRIKTGLMVHMSTLRDKQKATVSVIIDEDLGNAFSAPYRWIDHTRLFPTDTLSTYVIKLANKPEGLERADIIANYRSDRDDDDDRRYNRYDDD